MSPAPQPSPSPRLAILVVVFNMRREAPRTLYSLSSSFQRQVRATDYEVIVIENGSSEPLTAEQVAEFGDNFRYLPIENASPSPAAAVNLGAARTKAPFIGIMIDGARIASPGVVHLALKAMTRFHRAIVGTVGFHLGPDIQTRSPRHGYTREVEDRLLASIRWRANGYRLFEISALAGSSRRGWLGTLAESNLIFLPRAVFNELGGYDERFDLPGGGLVNLDFYRRACDLERSNLITLFGEGTFHQIHGGVITNKPVPEVNRAMEVYRQQYLEIRGVPFGPPTRLPLLLGFPRGPAIRGLQETCDLLLSTRSPDPHHRPGGPPDSPLPRLSAQRVADLCDPAAGNQRPAAGGMPDADDLAAALQFNLLTSLGLRSHHRLLDFGCGSLAAGRLLIPYLAAGHYWGVESNEGLVRDAIQKQLGSGTAALKKPNFRHGDDLDLDVFQTSFDFILAHSVFCHAGTSLLQGALQSAREALRPDGLLVATFMEHHQDHGPDEWVYPQYNLFEWKTLTAMAARCGLHCRKIDWPHGLQTWFVASPDLQKLQGRLESGGIDCLSGSQVLTAWRAQRQRKGLEPRFYLRRDASASGPVSD